METVEKPNSWKDTSSLAKESFEFYEDSLLKDPERNLLKLKSFVKWHVEDIIKDYERTFLGGIERELFSYEYNSKRIDLLIKFHRKHSDSWEECKNLYEKQGFHNKLIRFKWDLIDFRMTLNP